MRTVPQSLVKFMRAVYPYGAYCLADGSELLFTRDYKPFVMRDSNKQIMTPHDGSFVSDISWQGWFFNDLSAPWNGFAESKDSILRCQTALHRFLIGASITDLFVTVQDPEMDGKIPRQRECYPEPILKLEWSKPRD